MSEFEPVTVGLSQEGKIRLSRLKEDGHFSEMMDAYRFAVGLAIAYGAISEKKNTSTIFNVGSLDSDRSLYTVVKELRLESGEPVYKTIERLAEWGVEELSKLAESGSINFSKIFADLDKLSEENI